VSGFIDGSMTGASRFSSVLGLVIDTNGVMYVADQGNNAIRMISGGM
jgi:hypothetical protein